MHGQDRFSELGAAALNLPGVHMHPVAFARIDGVGVLRCPSYTYALPDDPNEPDPPVKTAAEWAHEMAPKIHRGCVLVLPNDRDDAGRYVWDFAIVGGDPGQVTVERADG